MVRCSENIVVVVTAEVDDNDDVIFLFEGETVVVAARRRRRRRYNNNMTPAAFFFFFYLHLPTSYLSTPDLIPCCYVSAAVFFKTVGQLRRLRIVVYLCTYIIVAGTTTKKRY